MSTRQKDSLTASWCAFHHFTKKERNMQFSKGLLSSPGNIYRLNWKQKQTCYSVWIYPLGLWIDKENTKESGRKLRKELDLCCLFEIWFLNAKWLGAQLCHLREIRYFAIFKCKVKYVFIVKSQYHVFLQVKGQSSLNAINEYKIYLTFNWFSISAGLSTWMRELKTSKKKRALPIKISDKIIMRIYLHLHSSSLHCSWLLFSMGLYQCMDPRRN